MWTRTDTAPWGGLTLPSQFLAAAGVVMTLAAGAVGDWVADRIETAAIQNSGTASALIMESAISPLSQELATTDNLSPPARQALTEIFSGTALGERVVSYKIWVRGGRIAQASDASLIGQTFKPTEHLRRAWSGLVSASFEDLNDLENRTEAALGVPLLEVYSPLREAWTGKVIAVAEFYERADDLASAIETARQRSWLVVGGAFLASGILLFGIVQAGGRTIRRQGLALQSQLEKTERVSRLNAALRQRAVSASSRATAQMDRAMRRVGLDLHDGPAQYMALAALRLDAALGDRPGAPADASQVRQSLDKALQELRIISRGLALPALDDLALEGIVQRAVRDHESQTGMSVSVALPDRPLPVLDYARKLCLFRFLQEALSNATRHAGVDEAQVTASATGRTLTVSVTDKGQGFAIAHRRALRDDGGQGLFGLEDRAESLGGTVRIETGPGGTTVTLRLPQDEDLT